MSAHTYVLLTPDRKLWVFVLKGITTSQDHFQIRTHSHNPIKINACHCKESTVCIFLVVCLMKVYLLQDSSLGRQWDYRQSWCGIYWQSVPDCLSGCRFILYNATTQASWLKTNFMIPVFVYSRRRCTNCHWLKLSWWTIMLTHYSKSSLISTANIRCRWLSHLNHWSIEHPRAMMDSQVFIWHTDVYAKLLQNTIIVIHYQNVPIPWHIRRSTYGLVSHRNSLDYGIISSDDNGFWYALHTYIVCIDHMYSSLQEMVAILSGIRIEHHCVCRKNGLKRQDNAEYKVRYI